MDLDSKEGKYHWKMVTAWEEGWKPLPLTTDNSDAIADPFKDRAGQFRFDPIINVPSLWNGTVKTRNLL